MILWITFPFSLCSSFLVLIYSFLQITSPNDTMSRQNNAYKTISDILYSSIFFSSIRILVFSKLQKLSNIYSPILLFNRTPFSLEREWKCSDYGNKIGEKRYAGSKALFFTWRIMGNLYHPSSMKKMMPMLIKWYHLLSS